MRATRRTAACLALALLAGCAHGGPPRVVVHGELPTADATIAPLPSGQGASGQADPLAAYYHQQLGWRSCDGGFSCAWLKVPLDYAHPTRSIELAVVRLPASGGDRIGALVLNPGGPGGSGIDYARGAVREFPADVLKRFDVVGFDPRGVGASRPAIRCVSGPQLDEFLASDPVPDDAAAKDALVAQDKEFVAGCAKTSGDLLAHVGTADAARDMDVLRAAIGDAKLTYVGKSYGTLLGGMYAEQFPTHVRALVLDGAVDPSLSGEELNKQQAVGFESALKDFIVYCIAHKCPLGDTPEQASAGLTQLFASIAKHPLPAPNAAHGPLMEAHAVLGVAEALYSPGQGWPLLSAALQQAVAGDGSGLMQLSDLLNDRNPDGSYGNLVEANTAVNCVDRPYPSDMESYDADAAALAAVAPHFGAATAYSGLICAYWPTPPTDKPRSLNVVGAPPILVIGTTNDPATPYQWAQSLSKQIAGSVLLTYRGEGHTVYGDGHSRCIDDLTDAYLIALTPPPAGEVCS